MSKEAISATVEETTARAVEQLADKEDRSFSKMVDILLKLGLEVFEEKKK